MQQCAGQHILSVTNVDVYAYVFLYSAMSFSFMYQAVGWTVPA
jgi:hypothetical protein